jgi:hypothetical protein
LPAAVSAYNVSLWWPSTRRAAFGAVRRRLRPPTFFGRRGVYQGAGLSMWNFR